MKSWLRLSIARRRREFDRIPAIQDVEARTQQSLGFSERASAMKWWQELLGQRLAGGVVFVPIGRRRLTYIHLSPAEIGHSRVAMFRRKRSD